MKLTMALASRGRPDLLLRTVKRTAANMVLPDTTFLVCLDRDDQLTLDTLKVSDFETIDPRIKISVRGREDSRGEKYDRALIEAPADIYLPTCDYSPLITPGFDRLIVEAAQTFPDGIGIVNTQMANLSFPHYQAMTAKLVAKLGYIYPHYFPFWFIDHWMDDIGRMIDRVAYADVACDPQPLNHGIHKTIGMRDLEFWTMLYDVGQVERKREALSILADMNLPVWRKAKLEWEFQFVHKRSMGINNSVRAKAEEIEKTRGGVESEADERYQRIKARADVLMDKWTRDLAAEHKLHLVSNNAEPEKVPAAPRPETMSADEVKQFLGEKIPETEGAKKNICLALLAYDSRVLVRTMMCLLTSAMMCMSRGWGITLLNREADSMVARGRSLLASQFLEHPAVKHSTDLVMVDTDLAWDGQGDKNEFVKLCAHNVDVVGGAYPFKDESGDFPLRWPSDGLMEREDGLWEVQAVTPGFFRVTRRALEKIAREMPWLEFKDRATADGQRQWMFFDNLARPGGVYDEGYVFCERWRTVGGKVHLDPDLNLTHIGIKAFNHGTLREWLARKAQVMDRLQSEYPGIPPLLLGKAVMEKNFDLAAELAKVKPESAA